MDWIGKLDWENLVMFNPNAIDCPPRKNPTDWTAGVEEENAISYGGGGGGGGGGVCSGSEFGHGSSARSSISVSTTDSSSKIINGINVQPKHLAQTQQFGNPRVAATGYGGEPVIGLKLGKRTYFENSSTGSNNAKNACIPPVMSTKKIKSCSSQRIPSPRCQVEGCNLDLSSAKEYHRKHRVCDAHSKSQKVVVGGLDRRFCQQCSRFHSLSEFDEKKRSCRRRLSDHNARRRKPHQEAIQFSSTRVSAPFLDGGHQISFIMNSAPVLEGRSYEIPLWESTSCSSNSSKFMLTKEYHPWKSEGMPPIWQGSVDMLSTTTTTQGLKKSMIPSSSSNELLVPAPDDDDNNNSHCALSLLSNNISLSSKQAFDYPHHQPPSSLSFPSTTPTHHYWQPANDSAAVLDHHGAQFQEIQLLKQQQQHHQPSYYTDIYSNILNK